MILLRDNICHKQTKSNETGAYLLLTREIGPGTTSGGVGRLRAVLGRAAGGGVEAPASGGRLARAGGGRGARGRRAGGARAEAARAGQPGERRAASASSRERGGRERGPASGVRRAAAACGGGGRAGAGKSNDPQRPLGRCIKFGLFAEGLDPGPSAKRFLFFLINFFAEGLT